MWRTAGIISVLALCMCMCTTTDCGPPWNASPWMNGCCACFSNSDRHISRLPSRRSGSSCKREPSQSASERRAIDGLLKRQLDRIDHDAKLNGISRTDFEDRVHEVIELEQKTRATNYKRFQLDMLTEREDNLPDIGMAIFTGIISLLGSLPGIPEGTQILQKVRKTYELVNDGTQIVGASFALGTGVTFVRSYAANAKSFNDHQVAVVEFIQRYLSVLQLTEANVEIEFSKHIRDFWEAYDLPKSVQGNKKQISLLQAYTREAYNGLKTANQAYRELLATYFAEAGVGLVVRGEGTSWDWTLAGIPENVNRNFMPKLLDLVDGCLNPNRNLMTPWGAPIQTAIFVRQKKRRLFINHIYTGPQDAVDITRNDEEVYKGTYCYNDQSPMFRVPRIPVQAFMVGVINISDTSDSSLSDTSASSCFKPSAFSGVITVAGLFYVTFISH